MILFALIVILEPTVGASYPFATHSFYLVSCGLIIWWGYRKELQLINPFRAG
jgi:hypothetical protein